MQGFHKASRRYMDLLEGSCNGNYPPENVLEATPSHSLKPKKLPGLKRMARAVKKDFRQM